VSAPLGPWAAWLSQGPWLVVAFPLAAVAAVLHLRLFGGPGWVNNPGRAPAAWLVLTRLGWAAI
jgi:hypothetical protein